MAEQNDDDSAERRRSDRETGAPQISGIQRLTRRTAAPADAGNGAAEAERSTLDAIEKVFVRDGRAYRFPDGAEAFIDQGDRITSQSENLVVVRAVLDLAVARDWQSLAVSGTEPFRQAVWTQATERGLEVKGYTPTEVERARLASRTRVPTASEPPTDDASSVVVAAPTSPSARPAKTRKPIEGTLLEHGRAPYQDNADNAMSYFARIRTTSGERKVWGVDLERALRESVSAPRLGDDVIVRQMRAEPVTVKVVERGEGDVVRETSQTVLRNRWSVETQEFVNERREASERIRDSSLDPKEVVRSRPDLAGAYLAVRGAEVIAQTKIPHPEDQTKFVDLVRTAIADRVERGEPMPKVKLRVRTAQREKALESRERGVD